MTQEILPPIGETIVIKIPQKIGDVTYMATIRATGEPGVSKEVLEAEVRRVHAAIERGEYEPIDVKDIDGHLTQRNITDIVA